MRKIREVAEVKQSAVAHAMNITQQAYSFLEQGNGSPRIDTLSFLLAFDVPITEANIEKYGTKGFADLISEHKRLEQKLEFFNYLIKNNAAEAMADRVKPLAVAVG